MTTDEDTHRPEDRLSDLNGVVRRVIGARVRDPQLVEDLTQDTLLRVATRQGSLTGDALQAYAIVTARNAVIGQARTDSVRDRHAHRLVDYTSFDGPEALVLEREETDALADALQQLDPDERHLLLRHETEGVTTETLAADAGTSKGAVAMRLVRARSVLRVEFLLAFRRVDLPSSRCRPVLLALSAGDRRRQRELDAANHLLRCSTCAELAQPVTERRRGIAAWLLVPAAELVRRAADSLRHQRGTQVAAAATVVAAAVGVLALVSLQRSDDGPTRSAAIPAAIPAASVEVSAPAPTAASTVPVAAAAPATVVTAAPCPPPAPIEQLDPGAAIGCPIAATSMTVLEVPIDEGFWAETADGRQVWVQLAGVGESPIDVDASDVVVVLTGVIADPAALDPAAADPRIAEIGWFLQVDDANVAPG